MDTEAHNQTTVTNPDPAELETTEKPFRGNRAITIATIAMFIVIFIVAMTFHKGILLPVFIPTFGYIICWFRHFRHRMSLDAVSFSYAMGFLGYGLAAVLYASLISLLMNSIWPHDSTLSKNYIMSNFVYAFLGGALATEVSRYMISKKIREDRPEDDVTLYLFNAMAGNLGCTTIIMLLGNSGSLLNRVDMKKISFSQNSLSDAVIVRSVIGIILQLLLGYRLAIKILKLGFWNKSSKPWHGTFAFNIIVRGLTDFLFFVVGIMHVWGAGAIIGIYLFLLIIVGIVVRYDRKFLAFSFDKSLEHQNNDGDITIPNEGGNENDAR